MTDFPENFVLLETLRRDRGKKRTLFFADPLDIIECRCPSQVSRCFRKMETARRDGFHLAGFFSYELGYLLEESLAALLPPGDFPLFWFGVYDKPQSASCAPRGADFYLSEPALVQTRAKYSRAVGKIRDLIAAGDTYQINYTTRVQFQFAGDVAAFYDRLKKNQKVSYSALVRYCGNALVSLSPELFFRTDRNGRITVKPMKGTAPLHTPADWLKKDPKNTSENVMIVDLLRNDLGRICLPGSVQVRKLFDIENYETLRQMTSTVTGKLHPGLTIETLVKSLFPCGSVTGAPKIRSMEIIHDLEDAPRRIYTGAIGYFAPSGEAVFNVAIRTLDLRRKESGRYDATMGVGSGIVFDSRADEEYDECLLKARFLQNAMPSFGLIETLRVETGRVRKLSDHLRRLRASADFFGIPCPAGAIRNAIRRYSATLPDITKLRLILSADGTFRLESGRLPETPSDIPTIALSSVRMSSADPFIRHKTTFRKAYDDEFAKYSAKGFFDVIFLNEKGQVTEGAISNLFVRIRGRWYTPPVSCGLLPGILRRTLMKKWSVRERILSPDDLRLADQIVLSNAVRGITEVRLRG